MSSVSILLATFNGAQYLKQQLLSYLVQTHQNWSLTVSDDGSTDGTHSILSTFKKESFKNEVEVLIGPGAGFVNNFLFLLKETQGQADFAALSDQDDIWYAEKLERAVSTLQSGDSTQPALYCGRTDIIDARGRRRGCSPLFRRAPDFSNALVQSLAGGNTMVLNAAAVDLVASVRVPGGLISHDWWIYQLVSGAGGRVIYDPMPNVGYRQHTQNLRGANLGLAALVSRTGLALGGRYQGWIDANLAALQVAEPHLTLESRSTLAAFRAARSRRGAGCLSALIKAGVRRQTRRGQAALLLGALLGRV